jgi:hypothetical protein
VSIHSFTEFNQHSLTQDNKSIAAAANHVAAHTSHINVSGKQLTLQLADHSALLGKSSSLLRDVTLQQGSIAGVKGSWVRLTQVAAGMHGLIWDGKELYAIEPTAEVSALLDPAIPAPQSGDTIIFKLSDVSIDLGGDYCASGDHLDAATTGLATYQALTAELAQPAPDSGAPTLRLGMQALGDAAMRAQYDSDQDAMDAIVVRLNNVDGIFTAQLGLAVEATNIRLLDAQQYTVSASTDPGTLLSSLAELRSSTPGMSSYAATHLFTGRDLDGDVLGISYIGNLCGARYAASLSEMRDRGAWLDSLVAAHELGHQLGAVHDGTGMCSDTPSEGYLMSSIISGTDEFSACSRASILAGMQQAACLVPIGNPDLGGATSGAASSAAAPIPGGGGGTLSPGWLVLLSTLAGLRQLLLRRRTTYPVHQARAIHHA